MYSYVMSALITTLMGFARETLRLRSSDCLPRKTDERTQTHEKTGASTKTKPRDWAAPLAPRIGGAWGSAIWGAQVGCLLE